MRAPSALDDERRNVTSIRPGRQRHRGRALVFAALLTVLAVTSQAYAAPSGLDGDIAFESKRAGSWDIFAMNADGSSEHRLSGNRRRAADSRPAWAPPPNELPLVPSEGTRGEKLTLDFCPNRFWFGLIEATVECDQGAFSVTVPDGATTGPVCFEMPPPIPRLEIPVRVDPNPYSVIDFTVLPDSQASTRGVECPTGAIVFQSNRTGDYDLWALDSARYGGVETAVHVLNLPGTNETAPAWSPRQDEDTNARPSPLIAFARRSQGSQDIWVFDPSRAVSVGTNPSRLTSGAADDTNPDWSPDGGSIAFERHRGKRTEIWLMDVVVDGEGYRAEGLRNRTADQPPSFDPTWYQYDAGPGNRVYEQITFGGPNGRFGFDLNYIEQDVGVYLPRFQDANGIRARFFHRRGVEASPAYSPMGAAVAFTGKRRGNSDVYLIQVGGAQGSQPSFRSVKRLTKNRADDRNPAWQAMWHQAQVGYRRPWGRRARFPRRPECRVFQPAAELAAHTCASPTAYR
jgi:hypothetical protein